MDRNDSHGRHGGNRGSGESREGAARDPAQRHERPADAQAEDRNEARAGGKRLGEKQPAG